jgi:hypothetical protein
MNAREMLKEMEGAATVFDIFGVRLRSGTGEEDCSAIPPLVHGLYEFDDTHRLSLSLVILRIVREGVSARKEGGNDKASNWSRSRRSGWRY